MKYTVIYEPGVVAAGDSRGEIETLIAQAVEIHLHALREEGIPIPAPSSYAGVVEISPAAGW